MIWLKVLSVTALIASVWQENLGAQEGERTAGHLQNLTERAADWVQRIAP